MFYQQLPAQITLLSMFIILGHGFPVYNRGAYHYPIWNRPTQADRFIERLGLSANIEVKTTPGIGCPDQDLLEQQHNGIAIDSLKEVTILDTTVYERATSMKRVNSRDMMVLTDTQKQQVLNTYGSYFGSNPALTKIEIPIDVKETKRENSRENVPPEQGPQHSEPRTRVEVCPRVEKWETLMLARNAEGNLVQLVQFPEEGMVQWFLNEECSTTTSTIVNNVSCDTRSRLVKAIVIDQETSRVTQQHIQVNSCAAHTFLSR